MPTVDVQQLAGNITTFLGVKNTLIAYIANICGLHLPYKKYQVQATTTGVIASTSL
jgi:hypothetical protein